MKLVVHKIKSGFATSAKIAPVTFNDKLLSNLSLNIQNISQNSKYLPQRLELDFFDKPLTRFFSRLFRGSDDNIEVKLNAKIQRLTEDTYTCVKEHSLNIKVKYIELKKVAFQNSTPSKEVEFIHKLDKAIKRLDY